MIKDVMVFVPMLRLVPETIESIFSLEWEGAISILFQRDNPVHSYRPLEDGYANHLHQFQRGMEVFLSGRYEAMLVVEHDIIVPSDALKRLAGLEADVGFGVYVFRHSPKTVNVLERYAGQARNVGESLSARGQWEAAKKRGVIECSGCGFGCTLIKREVLDAVPFARYGHQERGFFDWGWNEEVYRAGFKMMADTGVVCGHKCVDGAVLWPG